MRTATGTGTSARASSRARESAPRPAAARRRRARQAGASLLRLEALGEELRRDLVHAHAARLGGFVDAPDEILVQLACERHEPLLALELALGAPVLGRAGAPAV